jgi:hypothetical protein
MIWTRLWQYYWMILSINNQLSKSTSFTTASSLPSFETIATNTAPFEYSTRRNNQKRRPHHRRSSNHQELYHYVIIAIKLSPYFLCVRANHPPTNNNTFIPAECSISHIKQQQQRILISFQQQQQQQRIPLRPSMSLSLTHIQRIDASYQMMNAIYIRITIVTATTNITTSTTSRTTAPTNNDRHTVHHNKDTDTHLQQIQMLLLSELKEQYQPKIPDILQIYMSSSSSSQQSIVADDYDYNNILSQPPPQNDISKQNADGERCHRQYHNHLHCLLLVPTMPIKC